LPTGTAKKVPQKRGKEKNKEKFKKNLNFKRRKNKKVLYRKQRGEQKLKKNHALKEVVRSGETTIDTGLFSMSAIGDKLN